MEDDTNALGEWHSAALDRLQQIARYAKSAHIARPGDEFVRTVLQLASEPLTPGRAAKPPAPEIDSVIAGLVSRINRQSEDIRALQATSQTHAFLSSNNGDAIGINAALLSKLESDLKGVDDSTAEVCVFFEKRFNAAEFRIGRLERPARLAPEKERPAATPENAGVLLEASRQELSELSEKVKKMRGQRLADVACSNCGSVASWTPATSSGLSRCSACSLSWLDKLGEQHPTCPRCLRTVLLNGPGEECARCSTRHTCYRCDTAIDTATVCTEDENGTRHVAGSPLCRPTSEGEGKGSGQC